MFAENLTQSFVVRDFLNFYYEVIRHRDKILVGYYQNFSGDDTPNVRVSVTEDSPAPTEVTEEVEVDIPILRPETTGDELAQYISGRLVSLLESQALYAVQQGGDYVADYYREAQYVMAALGDEIFLNFNWSGRSAWENTLIESQVFQSHQAGAMIFQKLDAFLQKRDTAATPLALIYLYALGLGFQGKYRGQLDMAPLEQYKRALYLFIQHKQPLPFNQLGPISPDALAYTLEGRPGRGLPNPHFWVLCLLGTLIFFLCLSFGLWCYLTAPLSDVLAQVMTFAPSKAGGGGG